MEYLRNNDNHLKFSINLEYCLLVTIALVMIFLYHIVADRDLFLKMGMPTLKLKYFDITGHMKFMPGGMMHNSIDANMHILQVLCGYTELFKKEKLFGLWVGYKPFVFLVGPEAIEELLSTTTTLEKAWSYDTLHPWLGTGLLTSKGSKWKSRRKLLTPSFHFDILKEFLPVFNTQCDILVDILKKETTKEWTDVANVITLCSLDIICETTLGVCIGAQHNSESEYVKAVQRVSEATMNRIMNPWLLYDFIFYKTKLGRQFKKDLHILHTFTRNVIKKKKFALLNAKDDATFEEKKKRKALMDVLLDHHINKSDFTEEDIREEVDTFTFEGHDTTSMNVSWTLYLLGLYPDVQEKVHEEIDTLFHNSDREICQEDLKELQYLECVIKESLRLYPSVPLFARQANEKTVLGGYNIPKGTVCNVFPYMLHRDPDIYPNPEVFDPNRFNRDQETAVKRHPYAFIPFSAGPRNCIGQRFAMMEVKTVIASVMRHFNVTSLEQRDKIRTTPDLILRSVDPIKVKFSLRKTD